jgi:hypothetical protein
MEKISSKKKIKKRKTAALNNRILYYKTYKIGSRIKIYKVRNQKERKRICIIS